MDIKELRAVRERTTNKALAAKAAKLKLRGSRIAAATADIDAALNAAWDERIKQLYDAAAAAITAHEDALIAAADGVGTKMVEWSNREPKQPGRLYQIPKTVPWRQTGRHGVIEVVTRETDLSRVKCTPPSVGSLILRYTGNRRGEPSKLFELPNILSTFFYNWYPEGVHPDTVKRERPMIKL